MKKKKLLTMLALLLTAITPLPAQDYVPTAANMAAREKFQDAKLGIFIHWGVYSMLSDGEWVQHSRTINRDEYAFLPGGFYPSRFNADEWVKAFKAAGARYMTITSRHHDGFSMFKTDATDFDVVDATPFHRDPIKELADACEREGLTLNFYYSHMDWHRTDYPLGSASSKLPHDESTTNWQQYYRFMNQQLTELLTQYGPIGAIWFDGEWDHKSGFDWQLPEQYRLIHRLQPACLVGNNHHHAVAPGEDIQIFEQDLPGQNTAGFSDGQQVSTNTPLETCLTMNNTWGYSITDKNYKSTEDIIRKLVHAAGLGANLLLNIGPRPDGQLPEEALERLTGIGQWMSKYGDTIYGTRAGMIAPSEWGVSTQCGKKLFLHILNPATASITLPIASKTIRSIRMYSDGTTVKYTKGKSTVITLPTPLTDVDTVIEVELK